MHEGINSIIKLNWVLNVWELLRTRDLSFIGEKQIKQRNLRTREELRVGRGRTLEIAIHSNALRNFIVVLNF